MTFVGRERELCSLEKLYATPGFQMPIVYGRRRVGKTSLLDEFVRDKPTIFFSARETTAQKNLAALSQAIAEMTPGGPPFPSDSPVPLFASFEDAFAHIFHLAESNKFVFVIDEYPYLAESDRAVSSLLQHAIDHRSPDCQLFLVLCGSSMSFMEHQVLGYKSPLYGRRTAQIKVEPFSITQASLLLDGLSAETIASWYGIVGGIPLYLNQLDHDLSLEENLTANILSTDSFLFGEPSALLQQEVRDPASYNAIIQAIASGAGKPSEIGDASGIAATAVTPYLKVLIELGLLKKERPVVDANKKKVRYALDDNLFRFWHRFVPRYLTPLQAGREKDVGHLIADAHLSTFLGPAFEDICRQWLIAHMGTDDIPLILDIGRWWGTDPSRQEQAEIDIVALGDNNELICGECKWQAKLTDMGVLRTLQHRAQIIAHDRKTRLFLFSKSGFTDECRAAAREIGCTLVALADMEIGA